MVPFASGGEWETRNQFRGRLCFPQGRIDTGAHDKHLIGHAKETNKLWQNLVRAMEEGFEANAHHWNSPGDAPATGSGLGPCAAVVLNEIAARAYFPHKPCEKTEKQI
jgi:hypothetical protein